MCFFPFPDAREAPIHPLMAWIYRHPDLPGAELIWGIGVVSAHGRGCTCLSRRYPWKCHLAQEFNHPDIVLKLLLTICQRPGLTSPCTPSSIELA